MLQVQLKILQDCWAAKPVFDGCRDGAMDIMVTPVITCLEFYICEEIIAGLQGGMTC